MSDSSHRQQQLLNRCNIIEHSVSTLVDEYSHRLGWAPAVLAELQRLANRTREYEHGTFITLVVGPAKSGKSTLVNLLAGAYVSPTDFLECTVRPSVISRHDDGEESSLTIYSGIDSDSRTGRIDSIIDTIRGFGDATSLTGIECRRYPLAEATIREHVQLGLKESLNHENLISAIKTPGGKFLQERVFIVDMPGFDGAYQNIDDPVYHTIAQRADLIIFVQSSNAAFSNVSKQFLSLLARTNHHVPVCLVHNVFDAAWWRDKELKDRDAAGQLEFARNEISSMGFHVDSKNAFTVNLGAVQDYRAGNHRPELAEAAEVFDTMEQTMYDRIITNRNDMRLSTAIERCSQQREHLLELARTRLAERESLQKRYATVKESLAQVGAPVIDMPDVVPPSAQQIFVEVDRVFANSTSHLGSGSIDGSTPEIKMAQEEATDFINKFIGKVESALCSKLDALYGIDGLAATLHMTYLQALAQYQSIFLTLGLSSPHEPLPPRPIRPHDSFKVEKYVKIEEFLPKKSFFSKLFTGGHTGTAVKDTVAKIREYLAPTPDPARSHIEGIIVAEELPSVTGAVREAVAHTAELYREDLAEYVTGAEHSILSDIIPDIESYSRETETLRQFVADLTNINF